MIFTFVAFLFFVIPLLFQQVFAVTEEDVFRCAKEEWQSVYAIWVEVHKKPILGQRLSLTAVGDYLYFYTKSGQLEPGHYPIEDIEGLQNESPEVQIAKSTFYRRKTIEKS